MVSVRARSLEATEMEFELPEELEMLRGTLRRFVDNELIPIERETLDGAKLKPEIEAWLKERAEALGLWRFDVPTEFGGLGLGLLAKSVVWAEVNRTIALPTRMPEIFGGASPILYRLTEAQQARYLHPVLEGKRKTAFAQTEADAGSDPAAMRTTARRDGDHYVLNGSKRFISNAADADFFQVIAVTDREKGARGGISTLLVDRDLPGVTLVREQELITDDRPWELLFEDVRVPAENLVGGEGEGFRLAQSWINTGRIRHAARGMGIIRRCLELATAYAEQRVTFGEKLSRRQAVQWMLVDMYMNLHQLKLMVFEAASRFDRGEDIRNEAFMCKIFGDTKSFEAADACMQIHGGIGLTKELPIERFWRDQRSMIITEGPTEVLKMALARHVIGEFS
jgi:acyl-CoA dehydrogenase